MRIYLVIWSDRHQDIGVYPFSDRDKAIEQAKKVEKEYDTDGLDKNWSNSSFLYWAPLSCEGDNVRVEYAELDMEISL